MTAKRAAVTDQVHEPDSIPVETLPKGALGLAVIGFTPSWFSVIMGTGVLSTLIHQAPHQFRGMEDIGTALYLLNCFLFVLFLGISLTRYIMFPYVWRHLIRYPPQCFFLGTMPCGKKAFPSTGFLGQSDAGPPRCSEKAQIIRRHFLALAAVGA
ncbi:MAG: C4-dicarboxylate transporter malic acid transport [Trebouxia sp. A1-2]|nr:MAG: C4-dicarboxylate transporter malic acid transport [Trebouxia sp. A1-2]